MSGHVLGYVLVVSYVTVLLAVAAYGVHRYVLLYLYLKHREDVKSPLSRFPLAPRVTVQLPMYNEDVVAERIIEACCQIDYPLDRLEIQVLDDSTDHSAEIARKACEYWAAKGYPVKYVHRTNRQGYKAGALAAGLEQTDGELIAIFDADFVPPRDMLRNVVDYFTDPKIGMVQVRWDHLNREASLLTRSQAIFLDGHFMIEHTARNRSGRFMHFNGTAGVWRRTTIQDAGGWQHDTLTEDLDLSYRAQMKGWQFLYLPQYAAPAELPPEMLAFKQQAHRWTKGSFQTAIKLLPRLLMMKLPGRIKSEGFFHLTNTLVYPLMVLLTLLMYPAFFVYAQSELFGKKAGWRTLLYMPALMALGVGICINNSKAVLEAIWSAIRRKPSEFVRTPKYGVVGLASNKLWRRDGMWSLKKLTLPAIEIGFGLYMAWCLYTAVAMLWQADDRLAGVAGIPFLFIFSAGYLYVGTGTLYALWKMHHQQQPAAQPAPITSATLPQ